MAMKKKGFALLIAVIFMSVMLTFGLALGALAYKQGVLSSSSVESQHAFYAADAGLECVLYYDQQESWFAYPDSSTSTPDISCDGQAVPKQYESSSYDASAGLWALSYSVPVSNGAYCADVSINKYATTTATGVTTEIYAQGYSTSCATVGSGTFSSRGLDVRY